MIVHHKGRLVSSIFRMRVAEGQARSFSQQWKLRSMVLANGGTWLHVLRFVLNGDTGPIYRYSDEN